MPSKIVIIDYGAGNILSVKNMLKKVGAIDVVISNKSEDIEWADKLILPGVGHFDYGMAKLKNSGLTEILTNEVLLQKKIILGICLGAQLMTKSSEEGKEKGLGWVDARTIAFSNNPAAKKLKIPHMGWNETVVKKNTLLWKDMPQPSRFYFVHSFYLQMQNEADIWLSAQYGTEFCAAFHHDNIYACQFHPEKSHKFGMKLMENFVNF